MERFNKKSFLHYLSEEIIRLEKQYGFRHDLGYCQVEKKDITIIVAYGNYIAYCELFTKISY